MKRKLEKGNEYVIIETIESGEVYVQFVPNVWLVVLPNKTYKPRDPAKFYYPRRLPNQTRAKHLQFLKEAKFVCMKPTNDSNWELRDCRILKLGLDTIEDAIDNEKKFMEYFSTTDAETTLKKAAESKCVKAKKKKKVPAKKASSSSSSESDDETPAVTKIFNYNDQLLTNIQNLMTLDSDNVRADNNQAANQNLLTLDCINNVLLDNNHANRNVITMDTVSNFILADNVNTERDDCLPTNCQTTQNLFTLPDPKINQPNEFLTAIEVADFDEQELEDVDLDCAGQHAISKGCKCSQKVLNKIDYFSKKVFKELTSIREEIKSIRNLGLDRLNSHRITEESKDSNHEEQSVLARDKFEAFDTEYKMNFPAKNYEILVETNQSIASDENFKFFFSTKLEKHQGADETKTVRKILKSMCDVRCLNECTWSGTKNKDGTKKKESFIGLAALVDLIIKVIEKKFPNCEAMEILKSVVQQRTKSAPEAVANLIEKSQASQTTPIIDNQRQTAVVPDITIEQDSITGDHTIKFPDSSIIGDTNVVDELKINPELNGFRRAQDDVMPSSSSYIEL